MDERQHGLLSQTCVHSSRSDGRVPVRWQLEEAAGLKLRCPPRRSCLQGTRTRRHLCAAFTTFRESKAGLKVHLKDGAAREGTAAPRAPPTGVWAELSWVQPHPANQEAVPPVLPPAPVLGGIGGAAGTLQGHPRHSALPRPIIAAPWHLGQREPWWRGCPRTQPCLTSGFRVPGWSRLPLQL